MQRADKYMEAHLEIPDIVMTPSSTEKTNVDSATKPGNSKRRKFVEGKRVAPVSEV